MSSENNLTKLLFMMVLILIILSHIISNQHIDLLNKRIDLLQQRNTILESFMRNQRSIDKDQDNRISELILSIYPEPEP